MNDRRPTTFAALQKIYDIVYRAESVEHPKKGTVGKYGDVAGRDDVIMDFLLRAVSINRDHCRVLDASCGRGHLLRRIVEAGFQGFGTEIVSYLFLHDLKDFHVDLLGYHELKQLGPEAYDVVISSDVLEHLLSPKDVEKAIEDLCFISKQWVLITIGVFRDGAKNYPQALSEVGRFTDDLHLVKQPISWWTAAVEKRIHIEFEYRNKRHYYLFGKRRLL